MSETPLTWNGVLNPMLISDSAVAASHELGNAAKAGDWTTVFRLLDHKADLLEINWWRPGGTAWFTVLHQAAWHGAPVTVAGELVRRGALRTTVDSHGRTPYDVLMSGEGNGAKGAVLLRTHRALAECLAPPPTRLTSRAISALDQHLGDVIDGEDPRKAVRRPRSPGTTAVPQHVHPARGPEPAAVVPRAWDVRRVSHHAARRHAGRAELVPGRRRI